MKNIAISRFIKKSRVCYIWRNKIFMQGSMKVFGLDEKLPQLTKSYQI